MSRDAWIWLAIGGGLLLLGGGAVVVVNNDRASWARSLLASLRSWRSSRGEELPESACWILLAQAALETEWGKTAAAAGHNWWNMSAGAGWHGPVIPGPDTEPDKNPDGSIKRDAAGNVVWRNITQAWRSYPSDHAAISDLIDNWLTWRAYAPARPALFNGDDVAYLAALHAGGYFTLDLASYQSGVDARWTQLDNLIGNEA